MSGLLYAAGSPESVLDDSRLRDGFLAALGRLGPRSRVLAVPPDITRVHSKAGLLTRVAWEHYGESLTGVLPAIGTHTPMSDVEFSSMFGPVPRGLCRVHDWREGTTTLGSVSDEFVERISGGRVRFPWPVQVDKLIAGGGFDLILSFGQIVPHEVAGMSGYTKNILVGTGGREAIHKSHFLGAVHGIERTMGRLDNPVRVLLDHAMEHYAAHLPIVHVLTVAETGPEGQPVMRGLFVGSGRECFAKAAELSRRVNITLYDKPFQKVVVYLDPVEYRSTWLGNKSIYRTRMALAEEGELVVLAPGVEVFGEDAEIDGLIRRYGYGGRKRVLVQAETEPSLQANPGAAAHLIHGSAEGRFTVTYCPGKLTREEIEGVGYEFGDLDEMRERYDPLTLRDGVSRLDTGEEILYVSNPGLGLWATREMFESGGKDADG